MTVRTRATALALLLAVVAGPGAAGDGGDAPTDAIGAGGPAEALVDDAAALGPEPPAPAGAAQ